MATWDRMGGGTNLFAFVREVLRGNLTRLFLMVEVVEVLGRDLLREAIGTGHGLVLFRLGLNVPGKLDAAGLLALGCHLTPIYLVMVSNGAAWDQREMHQGVCCQSYRISSPTYTQNLVPPTHAAGQPTRNAIAGNEPKMRPSACAYSPTRYRANLSSGQ